jgi:hypothetical protein
MFTSVYRIARTRFRGRFTCREEQRQDDHDRRDDHYQGREHQSRLRHVERTHHATPYFIYLTRSIKRKEVRVDKEGDQRHPRCCQLELRVYPSVLEVRSHRVYPSGWEGALGVLVGGFVGRPGGRVDEVQDTRLKRLGLDQCKRDRGFAFVEQLQPLADGDRVHQ